MDIIQEFIKASLKETRSDMSVMYNNNLSYSEKLAIILAKNLNGKILKKDKYGFSLQFNLPQNYNLEINDDFRGSISLNEKSIFYWKNLYFIKDRDIDYLTAEAKDCENKYNVPSDVSLAALNIASKMLSIKATFDSQNLSDKKVDKRASTKARRNLEIYKKEQAYYRSLFIKSKAISEEDLEEAFAVMHESQEQPGRFNKYVAAAYIKTSLGYVFFKQARYSVKAIAADYIANRGYNNTTAEGSLSNLANI